MDVAAAVLRRFGLVDRFGLRDILTRAVLPSEQQLTRRLRIAADALPAGCPAAYLGKVLFDELVRADRTHDELRHQIGSPPRVSGSPMTAADVCTAAMDWFRHLVEQKGHGKRIRGDETLAQQLFEVCLDKLAEEHGLDSSREVATGRGPVDFKLSRGGDRVLIEMKRASHTAYWHGLKAQLPTYLAAAKIKRGVFVTIVETDEDGRRLEEIEKVLEAVRERVPFEIHSEVIDARDRPSASKLRSFD